MKSHSYPRTQTREEAARITHHHPSSEERMLLLVALPSCCRKRYDSVMGARFQQRREAAEVRLGSIKQKTADPEARNRKEASAKPHAHSATGFGVRELPHPRGH
ncbi:hypothetical protein VNO77_19831 [Canavalia gladiata]|uniref:Uncharacterized protein n=1 Tax=Canavalia gladiata TaxID=3824 RepID=A0AAN9LNF2_CANGL